MCCVVLRVICFCVLPITISFPGVISVSDKLDSQAKSLYTFYVFASDRGIPHAMIRSTTVTVNLTDYSNHAPEFAKVAWVGVIPEGLRPTFVLGVEASDPDSGILGEITYSIIGELSNYNYIYI